MIKCVTCVLVEIDDRRKSVDARNVEEETPRKAALGFLNLNFN
jgi:hypothetical protein